MQEQARPGYEALLAATFRKSSFSSGAGECVAVGRAADLVGVEDTKNKGTIITFDDESFALFVSLIK